MATILEKEPPRSVFNLHHQAQISNYPLGTAPELLQALKRPTTPKLRQIAAQAIQEAEIPEMADLLVDRVLSGAELQRLLLSLAQDQSIRRPDLLEWAARFA